MRLKLTKKGEHGVQIMRVLAQMPEGTKLRAQELAEKANVPIGFVPTIVATLHRAGLLRCQPGRTGGCQLGRPPEEISALDIITALEGPLTDKHCILDGSHCLDDVECELHESWSEAKLAIARSLESRKLDEMASHEGRNSPSPGEGGEVSESA